MLLFCLAAAAATVVVVVVDAVVEVVVVVAVVEVVVVVGQCGLVVGPLATYGGRDGRRCSCLGHLTLAREDS